MSHRKHIYSYQTCLIPLYTLQDAQQDYDNLLISDTHCFQAHLKILAIRHTSFVSVAARLTVVRVLTVAAPGKGRTAPKTAHSTKSAAAVELMTVVVAVAVVLRSRTAVVTRNSHRYADSFFTKLLMTHWQFLIAVLICAQYIMTGIVTVCSL